MPPHASPFNPLLMPFSRRHRRALEAIIPFLKKHRQSLDDSEAPADPMTHDTTPKGMMAAAVDTALLKAYVATSEVFERP